MHLYIFDYILLYVIFAQQSSLFNFVKYFFKNLAIIASFFTILKILNPTSQSTYSNNLLFIISLLNYYTNYLSIKLSKNEETNLSNYIKRFYKTL